MNDKELADAVVALGVGSQVGYPLSCDGVGFYHTPEDDCDESEGVYSKLFVRDWRVAGALMEKVNILITDGAANRWRVEAAIQDNAWGEPTRDESLPRAIIEACVEALT